MNRDKCTEELAVKVFFNGASLAGCQLNAGKEGTSAKTDKNGNLQVRLENPGLQVLRPSTRSRWRAVRVSTIGTL